MISQPTLRSPQQDGTPLQSLSRGLTALSVILASPNGVSLTELAAAMGLHRATVLRLVRTLVQQGYVSADLRGPRYFAGPEILRHSIRAHTSGLAQAAGPVMSELSKASWETVALLVPAWPDLVCCAVRPSPHEIRRHREIGEAQPMTQASIGRAFLSRTPSDYIAATLAARPLRPNTPNSIVDVDDYLKVLEHAAKQGFAVSVQEASSEMSGVSAPVVAPGTDFPLGVINISGPSYRWDHEQCMTFGPLLARAVDEFASRTLAITRARDLRVQVATSS